MGCNPSLALLDLFCARLHDIFRELVCTDRAHRGYAFELGLAMDRDIAFFGILADNSPIGAH
jgi:hypothetical protein